VLVDWLHDRLYLLLSEQMPGEEQLYASTTSRTTRMPLLASKGAWRGQPFYLESCNLMGNNCGRIDIVFRRQPEYIQVAKFDFSLIYINLTLSGEGF
jgi:glucose-6-phosphate 1-dehydrogenase